MAALHAGHLRHAGRSETQIRVRELLDADSIVGVLLAADEVCTMLRITADREPAAALDRSAPATVRAKLADALATMHEYAVAKSRSLAEGKAAGPALANLKLYCQEPGSGALISPHAVILGETRKVSTHQPADARCADAAGAGGDARRGSRCDECAHQDWIGEAACAASPLLGRHRCRNRRLRADRRRVDRRAPTQHSNQLGTPAGRYSSGQPVRQLIMSCCDVCSRNLTVRVSVLGMAASTSTALARRQALAKATAVLEAKAAEARRLEAERHKLIAVDVAEIAANDAEIAELLEKTEELRRDSAARLANLVAKKVPMAEIVELTGREAKDVKAAVKSTPAPRPAANDGKKAVVPAARKQAAADEAQGPAAA